MNALIGRGLGIAATKLGAPFQIFRPTGAAQPLAGAAIATVMAVLDSDPRLLLLDPTFRHGSGAFLIADTTQFLVGDYLVGGRTVFVAQIEALRPASCVVCNRTLSVYQPATASMSGENAYGGRTTDTDTLLASGWPASILPKTHIDVDPTRLPSDVKTSFFDVLLPVTMPVDLSFGLRLQDDYGQSYAVSTASLTTTGWQLLAAIQTT